MAVLVITPEPIGAGHQRAFTRTVRTAWTQTSSDPRLQPVTSGHDRTASWREEVLDASGAAITKLVSEWEGARFTVETSLRRIRTTGATAEQAAMLAEEYAMLGDPEPIDREARAIAEGNTNDGIGTLVLALLMRHARVPGGYAASAHARVEARASSAAPGTFSVRVLPVARDPEDTMELAGELVMRPNGWPTSLGLRGQVRRALVSRFATTTYTGTLELALAIAYP